MGRSLVKKKDEAESVCFIEFKYISYKRNGFLKDDATDAWSFDHLVAKLFHEYHCLSNLPFGTGQDPCNFFMYSSRCQLYVQ